jgi:hypothetical protein
MPTNFTFPGDAGSLSRSGTQLRGVRARVRSSGHAPNHESLLTSVSVLRPPIHYVRRVPRKALSMAMATNAIRGKLCECGRC